jgi:polysaccharide export outer membrane protein
MTNRFRTRSISPLLVLLAGVFSCTAQIAPGASRPNLPPDDPSSPGYINLSGKPSSSQPDPTPGANIQPLGPSDFSVSARQDSSTKPADAATPANSSANANPQPVSSNNNPPAATAAQVPGWQPLLPPQPKAANNNSSVNNSGSPSPSASGTTNGVFTNSVATVTPAPAGPTGSAPVNLVIGKGDLIEVDVYAAPDFDKNVRVDSNGNASLPMIGPVKVEGLTTAQAQAAIAKRLADGQFFNDPQVTVFIKEYATQGITVMGEVQHPGIYPVLGPRTLFDAISLAGGTTPKAGNVVTVTRRAAPRDPTTLKLGTGGANSMESNVDIFPGDTVVVATAGIVYVVGAVRTPGGYVMDNGKMTLMQALAMAQGPSNTAALNRAKLVRRTPTGQQELPLPLNNIVAGKQSDIPLQAEDIVFVPNSTSKSAMRRGLEAALQAATGVAIYRP